MSRTRGSLRHTLLTLIVGAFVLGAMPSAVADAPSDQAASNLYERSTVNYTNAWRSANDKVKLKESPCLDTYAEQWAVHLAAEKSLVHRSSASLKSILEKCNKSGIGENLASGFSSGRATVYAWRDSPGHNRNMLTTKFRWTAVGAYQKDGTWWVVQLLAN